MSRIQVDNIFDKEGSGAPSLPAGVVVTGVSTLSSGLQVPGGTGVSNRIELGNSQELTLQYNTSSTKGIITSAANPIDIQATTIKLLPNVGENGVIVNQNGSVDLYHDNVKKLETTTHGAKVTGVCSATSFIGSLQVTNADFTGLLREGVKVTAGKLSDNTNINLDNGMAHLFTTTETTTATPNIMSATGINTDVQVGEAFSVSIIVSAAAAGYAATVHIDGASIGAGGGSLVWNGGEAPSAGGSSGKDYYTYNIIKTASSTYTVLGNVANFA